MQTVSKIWMDGKLIPWEKAQIHVLTHTFHYGGGAFEGIRFYETNKGPAVFRLTDHIKRLFYSASVLDMKIPHSRKDLENAVIKLIKAVKLKSGYIRPIVYYGYEKMGLDPIGSPVNTAIAVWPWGAYLGEKPVKTHISKFIRIHPSSTYPEAKLCGHYVNSILASLDARHNNAKEAILLDYKGNVAEGPGENIFMVKNGVLITPKKGSILSGITRDSLKQLAKKLKIQNKEALISKKELLSADEVFFSGTAAEVTAIGSIDGKKISNGKMGPITSSLKDLFTETVHGRVPEFKNWLTYVK